MNTVYFKDGHTEEILIYSKYTGVGFTIEFLTESGRYFYCEYYEELHGFKHKLFGFYKEYPDGVTRWIDDIDRIELSDQRRYS